MNNKSKLLLTISFCFLTSLSLNSKEIKFKTQLRNPDTREAYSKDVTFESQKTAIVVIDMWNSHWCITAASRVGALVPRMNSVIDAARKLGMTIIWNPSDVVTSYSGDQMFQNTLAVPPLKSEKTRRLSGVGFTTPRGACLCGNGISCMVHYGWDDMNHDLIFSDNDYVVGTTDELYSVLKSKNIDKLIFMGVHTNICVFEKPGAIGEMWDIGYEAYLARDINDACSMYDPDKNFTPDDGTSITDDDLEAGGIASINLKSSFMDMGIIKKDLITDFVRISPWGRDDAPYMFKDKSIVSLTFPEDTLATIYYTLDGTVPTSKSIKYSKPLTIDGNTTIKAVAFSKKGKVSLDSKGIFVKMPSESPLPDVYLDDLEYIRNPYTDFAKMYAECAWHPKKSLSYEGNPLSIRNKIYNKGVGFRAPSSICYDLKPEYKRFVAKVGIDDNAMKHDKARFTAIHSSVIFKVYIDGKLQAESALMIFGQEPWNFNIEIPQGARSISLVCTDGGSRNVLDLGNWVEAGFIL